MDILKKEVIAENGSFKTERIWARGWLNIPGAYHVWGWTGRETFFTRTYIVPNATFEVKETYALVRNPVNLPWLR